VTEPTVRIAWTPADPIPIYGCQAPRHEGRFVKADWIIAVLEPGEPMEVYWECTECVDLIAAEIGTTAEEGKIPW
jgi:hypothetical protein